ncbi:MAG TPA: hypothetical protein VKB03_05960 [Conexibacter sp.]|nr:hypothetical protein [Conexibacter sp.]
MIRTFRRTLLPTVLLLAVAAVPAAAHEGDPHYRSVVSSIAPPTDGLTAQILDHDDALQVVNKSDEDVTILDLQGKPYARLHADGTVQVNAHSRLAVGENAPSGPPGQDGSDSADAQLYASVTLLAHGDEEHEAGHDAGGASEAGEAGVDWITIDRTGRYQWHDPRINYRTQPVPPQVTDESKETKLKDWRVPLLVAGVPGAIDGTLTWVGEPGSSSSFPTAAVVSLVVLLLLAVGAVVLVRRRRAEDGAQT